MRKFMTAAAGLALVAAISGCIKFKQELAIMPDGSGKMALVISINEAFIKGMAGAMGGESEEGSSEVNLKSLDDIEGIVAFTEPKEEIKDGWKVVTVTGYFEDVNKLKLHRDEMGEKKPVGAFEFAREGDGFRLSWDDSMFKSGGEDDSGPKSDQEKKMAWGFMQNMIKGLEITMKVSMPGAVSSTVGFAKKEGRAAWNSWSSDEMKSYDDFAAMSSTSKRKIVCGRSGLPAAEVEAFKKELAQAKAAWPAIKERLAREASRKKDGKSDKGGGMGEK